MYYAPRFKHIQPDNKEYRDLLHTFGVVRLYRTFSIYIVIGETRCAGCLCTRSGWFKHIEPLLNLLGLQLHRNNKDYRGLLNEFGVVRPYRTFSNYSSSGDTRCARCYLHRFGEVQAHRTSSNLLYTYILTERYVEFFYTSSWWLAE